MRIIVFIFVLAISGYVHTASVDQGEKKIFIMSFVASRTSNDSYVTFS